MKTWSVTKLGITIVCGFYGTIAAGTVVYVNLDATGAENGSSWADAFTTIQAGVDAASSGDEVWVARGTYTATANPGVTMKADVALYGGFAGTETTREAREGSANVTAIDGGGTYRCLSGASNATLDGFTVQNGYHATERGVGMLNVSCTGLSVNNCTFTGNNAAHAYGGAMYNNPASLTMTNCSFTHNTASMGAGALFNEAGSSMLATNCSFVENSSTGAVAGAVFDMTGTSPRYVNCIFRANSAGNRGAGMYCRAASVLEGCVFAAQEQGALYVAGGSPLLKNCTFANNSFNNGGGAICISSGSASAVNCVFVANNTPGNGGAIYVNEPHSLQMTNCSLAANGASAGGAVYVDHASATIRNSVFWGNSSDVYNYYGTLDAQYSCVGGVSGTGNFSMNPLFVDGTDGGDGFDLRLQGGSPCINMGTNMSGTVPDSATDMVGVARPQGPAYDMGAYEFLPGPEAAFSALPTSGTVPLAVTFTDASTSSIVPVTAWTWDFGDGATSTDQNPAHTYSAAGVYAVSLTAMTASGSNSVTKLHYVTVGRGTPEVTQWPTADELTYGQRLSESALSGGLAADVPGSFAFAQPDVKPDAGTYAATVIFTPTDSVNFTPVTGAVDVDVYPASPSITTPPTATAIMLGQRLSSSLLLNGQARAGTTAIAGSFAYTQPLTLPGVSGPYPASITFTPADEENYLPATGIVSVPVEAGDCPECAETSGPYSLGATACLVVPGDLPPDTSFTWSRHSGAPLDPSRVAGIYCRRLQITGLEPSDAGTYLCTYDDSSAVDVYAMTIAINEASPVPVLPRGGRLLIVVALLGLAFTWRYRQSTRA